MNEIYKVSNQTIKPQIQKPKELKERKGSDSTSRNLPPKHNKTLNLINRKKEVLRIDKENKRLVKNLMNMSS